MNASPWRLGGLALCFAWQACAGEGQPPNILVAMADDWGLHAGAYGTPWVQTPAFDRIAREGLLFTRAYTPNAKCAPSRACLLTGRNPWQLEAAANHVCYFPSRFKGWMEVLEDRGWWVGHTQKGWGPGVATNALGQSRRLTGTAYNRRRSTPPASGISDNDYAANFADFLAAAPPGRPWCFWYGSVEPHRGFERGSGRSKGGRRLEDIDRVPAYWPDVETVRDDMLDYGFEVEHFDRHLGLMLGELEKRGQLESTLVVVTSDHGMPFPRVKGNTYESANHIPLAVMWQRGIAQPGRRFAGYVSFIDVAPTLLEVAGIAWRESGMEPPTGRSWTDIFRSADGDGAFPRRDHVLLGRERTDVGRPGDQGYPVRAMIRENHLFVVNHEPSRWPAGNPETGYLDCDGGPTKSWILDAHRRDPLDRFWALCFGKRPLEELYDLSLDPDAVINLAADPAWAARRSVLRAELDAALLQQDDPRSLGRGAVFDAYPYANPAQRDFHARFSRGEPITAGWVSATDFEPMTDAGRGAAAGESRNASGGAGSGPNGDTPTATPGRRTDAGVEAHGTVAEERWRRAARNGRLAAEALARCRRYVAGWLAHADPESGLIPRNLNAGGGFWNGRDAAADNYAFMVLTAALTDRALLEGRMLDMLRVEARLTARQDRLCDDYDFRTRTWKRATFDLEATLFDSAEYVKDGLLPITEWLGPSPWSERAIGLLDDIWSQAALETPVGRLPTLNTEVNGDLLQAGARLFWMTGEPRFLDRTILLGDYYLLGNHHPTRDFEQLRLRDHGGEIVNGLTELYVAVRYQRPAKADAYRAPLREMLDQVLERGRNADGLLFDWIRPATGLHSPGICDTWGYVLNGHYTVHLLEPTPSYQDAVRQALGALEPHYTNYRWEGDSADGYADAIEGALNLYRREPVESVARWLDTEIQVMWSKQRADGVIEGWHGDGNFARTSLLYALWKTQGLRVEPWRSDVELGVEPLRDGRLLVSLHATADWAGTLIFDRPRHREYLRLPLDYPRINQFPEWTVVREDDRWSLQDAAGGDARVETGRTLREGWAVSVRGGESRRWTAQRMNGRTATVD